MARVPLVAGNWKMNGTIEKSLDLVRALRPGLEKIKVVEKSIRTPFEVLSTFTNQLMGSGNSLGALIGGPNLKAVDFIEIVKLACP